MQIPDPNEQGKVGTRVFILGLEKAKEHKLRSFLLPTSPRKMADWVFG